MIGFMRNLNDSEELFAMCIFSIIVAPAMTCYILGNIMREKYDKQNY